uniref:Uncharacterized protein n=1 Tax=Panagrolaimus davidi TaxID=227884 RepID=A0A914PBN5_9BILA
MDGISAPAKKSKIQLITIDADQKLLHFQECKITINKIAKFLLMEPQIENIKVLVASFDKSFYRFKNILCILDTEENIYNYMLILRNTESCEKVFDVIQKSKEIKDTNLSNEKLFQQLFFPVLKEIQFNETLKTEIKLTLRKLFKTFKCRKYLTGIQMDKNFIVEVFGKGVTQAPELKDESPLEKKLKQNKTVDDEIIVKAPNFKVLTFTENGNERKRLFIFDDIDKTKCYEYSMQKGSNNYKCLGCGRKKKSVSTEIINKNGKEYVKFNKSMHICELRNFNIYKYLPEITEAPNFKVVNFKENGTCKKRLLIFDEKNKNKCYEYYWLESNQYFKCLGCHTKNVNTTTGIYKENGKEFVKLKKLSHVCEIRDYNPSKYSIVESPDTNMDKTKR